MGLVNRLLKLLGFIALAFITLAVGNFFSTPDAPWFQKLNTPPWTPPQWIFPIVWVSLFATIAAAGFFALNRAVSKGGWITYGLQYLLNALWPFFFFHLADPRLAFYTILALVFVVAYCTVAFSRKSLLAGMLLVPYLLWLLFALTINLWIAWPP